MMTKEIEILPESLTEGTREYFRTVADDTTLYAPGIGPCIGALFYRKGHLGLAHFNPGMEAVLDNISHFVKEEMEKQGTGTLRCRLFTGLSFAAREEFQGNRGIAHYYSLKEKIEEQGILLDEIELSRTYILANNGPVLIIEKLEAKRKEDNLAVKIRYFDKSYEEQEIDIVTGKTKIITPFTGSKYTF